MKGPQSVPRTFLHGLEQEQQSIWEAKLCTTLSGTRSLQGPGQEQGKVAACQKEGVISAFQTQEQIEETVLGLTPSGGIERTGCEQSGIQEGGTMLSQEQGHSPSPALP